MIENKLDLSNNILACSRKIKMKKLYCDLEFTGLHKKADPISIALLSEDGKNSFYAELTDFDANQINPWLKKNVINNLLLQNNHPPFHRVLGSHWELLGDCKFVIKGEYGLVTWLKQKYGKNRVTLTSFGAGYDWVILRQLLLDADLDPLDYFEVYPYDVASVFQYYGLCPNINGEKEKYAEMHGQKHNALFDTKAVRAIDQKLEALR